MKRGPLQEKWKRQAAKRTKPTFVPQSQVRSRNKLNSAELKVFDVANSFTIDATGEVPATGQLNIITVGDTLNNRDGAVIQVKSIQMRGNVAFVPAAAATAATIAYIYIVQDRQCNGAAAAITDVLTSNAMNTALGNVPNQYRFKILKRIVLPLFASAGATTAYNNVSVPFDEYIKFPTPIEIRFTASAGAITDVASNNLFLLAGTDGLSDDTITVNATTRLRFTG